MKIIDYNKPKHTIEDLKKFFDDKSNELPKPIYVITPIEEFDCYEYCHEFAKALKQYIDNSKQHNQDNKVNQINLYHSWYIKSDES